MKTIQSFLAVLCVLLMAPPCTFAQQPPQQLQEPQQGGSKPDDTPQLDLEHRHWYSPITHKYETRSVPPVNVSNSGRIESLLRAGNLYLSLQDAIALSLENNIDIEVQRYQFPLAQTDLLRAKSGSPINGVNGGTGLPGGGASGPVARRQSEAVQLRRYSGIPNRRYSHSGI